PIPMNRFLYFCFFMLLFMSSKAQFTLIVDQVPTNTPGSDPIHVAGNFQNWNPGSAAHQLQFDSTQQYYIQTFPAGLGSIEFKFTRGSWSKVESAANGGYRPNRTHQVVEGDSLRLQILGWEDLDGGGGSPSTPSTAADNVTILSASFFMPQFNRNRRVWIYLPPDYETSGIDYPVLYMHDGQNVFDAATSFAGEWEVDETLNELHALGDPGIIVVAVDNGSGNRTQEYTPWPNSQYGGGEGKKYAEFLVQTLKPHIDSTYRTLPDREHTGIMGSSFGGLISTFAGIEYQSTFSKIGTFSPSYWFNSQSYTHVATTGRQEPMRIYQLAGGLEGSGSVVANMYRMQDTLEAAGFPASEIKSVDIANGQHSEWFWAQEFEAAYLWLFRSQTTQVDQAQPMLSSLQIVPNPVNEELILKFDLSQSRKVKIDILDISGRLQQTLWEGNLPAGSQQKQFTLSGGRLSSGIYICRISTTKDTRTAAFILK
ncbi:MAG: alpha/beta hydrolase-fold protein, partial [Bacteroidota bacterium]